MQKTLLFLLLLIGSQAMAQTSVRILTYNVYAKPDLFFQARMTQERMDLLCERLKTGPWDIVFLQEAWTANHRERLGKCGYEHVMNLRKTGSSKRERSLGSGLLILSRFPLANQQRIKMAHPTGFAAVFKHGEAIVRKSVYLAEAQLPGGKKLWLANTHLVANYCDVIGQTNCTSYEELRAKQLMQLSDIVLHQTPGAPVVFGGDLNMGPKAEAHDHIWDELSTYFPDFVQAPYDPETTATSSDTNSWNEHNIGKIDHLFVSPGLSARDGAVVLTERSVSRQNGQEMNISDHYGWETTVDIP